MRRLRSIGRSILRSAVTDTLPPWFTWILVEGLSIGFTLASFPTASIGGICLRLVLALSLGVAVISLRRRIRVSCFPNGRNVAGS